MPDGGAEFETPDDWPCPRPNFIEFFRCAGALLHGVTIKHSPMWSVHPVLTRNFWAHGVTIFTRGFNNDGIDPDMCQHVLIEKCTFSSSDDGVAIKAGRDTDGYDPPALRASEPTRQMYCQGPPERHIVFSPPADAGGASRQMGPKTSGVV